MRSIRAIRNQKVLVNGLQTITYVCIVFALTISAGTEPQNAIILPEKLVDIAPVLTPTYVNVNHFEPKVSVHTDRPTFSHRPSVKELFSANVMGEPMVPIGSVPTEEENAALAQALLKFADRVSDEDTSSLADFLRAYPVSPWNPSLLCNMGFLFYHTGHFTKAMAAWEKSWNLSKDNREPTASALADRALGELARMNARIGRFGRLETLFKEMGDRRVRGSATEKITGAKAGLWLMKNRPEVAFRCGPMALSSIQSFFHPNSPLSSVLLNSHSSQKGMTLSEIEKLGEDIHLNLQMAKRVTGAPIVFPSIIHWKLEHYAALLKQQGNLYLVRDPTFGEDLWVSLGALDEEASGYFLVPKGTLPSGWKKVGTAEGNQIFGKGHTNSSDENGTSLRDHRSGGRKKKSDGPEEIHRKKVKAIGKPKSEEVGECPSMGMPTYSFHTMLASLNIEDIPVGTTPPRGPDALFKIIYNQREANQPAIFTYGNLGQKWTFSWLSYIVDNPLNLTVDVAQYLRGGGLTYFKNYQSATHAYAPETQSGSILIRVSNSPIVYELRLNGGGKEVYSVPNGATAYPRKVFLTKIVNATGDSLTFKYDNALRLVSAKDALGQVTTIAYELAGC